MLQKVFQSISELLHFLKPVNVNLRCGKFYMLEVYKSGIIILLKWEQPRVRFSKVILPLKSLDVSVWVH